MASAARATTDARTRARTRRVEEDVLLTAVHVPARLRRGDGLQRVVGQHGASRAAATAPATCCAT